MAGLCRLSLAFHAACNGSPNVRSNFGQQVYVGHVCWLETACDDLVAFVGTDEYNFAAKNIIFWKCTLLVSFLTYVLAGIYCSCVWCH